MRQRPYVVLSVATSIDGFIDDTSPERLLLSNDSDFDRVDQVRAESDAILIGAGTMRIDNPRLLVNSNARRAKRLADGKPEYPLKVTVSRSGLLDRDLKWFHHGGARVVYTTDEGAKILSGSVGDLADVVALGTDVSFSAMLDDLAARGVDQLMVEGGESIHTRFIAEQLADELHLAIAPLFVGGGARFVSPTDFPWPTSSRYELIETVTIDDVVLIRYRLGND